MRLTVSGRTSRLDQTYIKLDVSLVYTVDILGGLPEGSRLSLILFGIFVADLVHELRAKFPQQSSTLDIARQTHTP